RRRRLRRGEFRRGRRVPFRRRAAAGPHRRRAAHRALQGHRQGRQRLLLRRVVHPGHRIAPGRRFHQIARPSRRAKRHRSGTGRVRADRAGEAALQAALDGGSYAPMNLNGDGTFSFATTLPLDHSADGPHTEHLRATDRAGNVSFFDVSFTLDTVSPLVAVSTPAPGLVTNQNIALTGQVTDDRSGVASLQAALDGATFGAVSLSGEGALRSATRLPLGHSADGPHAEHLRATDLAGNVSTFDVPFTLDTVAPTVSVTSPAPDLVTNRDVTVAGRVTDDRSGVVLLEEALD